MANTNTPFGLQVIRGGGAYSFNDQGSLYSIPTSDSSNAYYLNDAVKAAAGGSTEGIPNVTKAAGTDPLRGSIQAIYVVPPMPPASLVGTALALENVYIPATKAAPYFVLVDDDESTIYMVQDDGITTANLVAASCNLNSSLTVTNGATTTSPSGTVLLSSSFATGATSGLNMKLLGLVQQPGNTFAAYAKWQARINLGEFSPAGFAGV